MLKAVESNEATASRRRMSLLGIVAAVCAWCAAIAEAQLNITITEGRERAVPIAVVPFGWQGAGAPAFDLAGVVSADLGSSGRFAPMATSDMISRPTQASQVNFQQWRTLDADYLVIGTLNEDTRVGIAASYQLFPNVFFDLPLTYLHREQVGGELEDEDEETRDYAAAEPTLRWRLAPDWDFRLGYGFQWQQRDDSSGFGNAVFAFLTYRLPRLAMSR